VRGSIGKPEGQFLNGIDAALPVIVGGKVNWMPPGNLLHGGAIFNQVAGELQQFRRLHRLPGNIAESHGQNIILRCPHELFNACSLTRGGIKIHGRNLAGSSRLDNQGNPYLVKRYVTN